MLALPIILALFLHKNRKVRERLRSWSTKHLVPDVYLLLTTLFSLSPLAISYWKDSHYESLIENGSYTEFFSQTPIFAAIHFIGNVLFSTLYLYKCFNEFKSNRTNIA